MFIISFASLRSPSGIGSSDRRFAQVYNTHIRNLKSTIEDLLAFLIGFFFT